VSAELHRIDGRAGRADPAEVRLRAVAADLKPRTRNSCSRPNGPEIAATELATTPSDEVFI
jgi:hypothetical protein